MPSKEWLVISSSLVKERRHQGDDPISTAANVHQAADEVSVELYPSYAIRRIQLVRHLEDKPPLPPAVAFSRGQSALPHTQLTALFHRKPAIPYE